MSSGDIDDRLGPEGMLDNLRKHNIDLDLYLRSAGLIKPIRTFFIPYGAGISQDGSRVYISYDVQSNIDGVECEAALVCHETTEWALREYAGIGMDYAADPAGHRLANRAEYELVNILLAPRPDPWAIYSEVIDEQIMNAERIRFDNRPIPQDLALYPYDYSMRLKLQDAMHNDRSWEEWEKLAANKPYSKAEVDYTDDGSETEHCSNCDHYDIEPDCKIVRGAIVAEGWCNKWVTNGTD